MTRKWFLFLASWLSTLALLLTRPGRRLLGRFSDRAARRARYLAGRRRGVAYRLAGGHPDLEVDPHVLADRVRSELGPLEKRLDIPHVHVMVDGHLVLLHGDVGTERDAQRVEEAVGRVPGVYGLASYLHVGLLPSDSRPSAGRAAEHPSEALRRLLSAATDAGAGEATARSVVRAALATLSEQLPPGEREHLLAHLPPDVRALALPPRRRGPAGGRVRHVADFVASTGAHAIDPARASLVVESILGVVRELVPEETAGIAAVLPAELRSFWLGAVPQ